MAEIKGAAPRRTAPPNTPREAAPRPPSTQLNNYDPHEAESIARALAGKRIRRGWMAKCPAHEDGSESLSIDVGAGGRVLLHCFAGCSFTDIRKALEARGAWPKSQSRTLTLAERKSLAAELEANRIRRGEQRKADQAEAASRCRKLWKQAGPPDPQHPYLRRKKLPATGLRQLGDTLLVPMWNEQGQLVNLQWIFADGRKRFAKGGQTEGAFFAARGDDRLAIAEGWATAARIHEATGASVLAAMSAGNVLVTAEAATRRYPKQSLLIAADHDLAGIEAAQAACLAVGCAWRMPPAAGTDFADLTKHQTAAALRGAWGKSNAR